MKKLSVSALAVAAALVLAPLAAHAATVPGWYVGGGVGGSFADEADVKLPGVKKTATFDANVSELGDVGYAWSNGLRFEGEYFHNQQNVDKVNGLTGGRGHIINNDLFANAIYDIALGSSSITPYVGVGAGPGFTSLGDIGANGLGRLTGDTVTFAYQGIAGLGVQLDHNWGVTADYRYVATTDPKTDYSAGGRGRIDNASHNVIVGVRYSFGEEEQAIAPLHAAAAPAIAPHAASKQPIAAVPQSFTVFFDFNKSVLTPEAKRIIASAAQEFKRGGYVSITTTGHTDTVGGAAYNQKLSVRRAAAVEAELKRLGVSTSSIKEVGVGKNDLLVPTADGVREAQNRRAEIVLAK